MKRSFILVLAFFIPAFLGMAPPLAAAPGQRFERNVEVIELGGGYLGVQIRDVTSSDVEENHLPREAGAYVEEVEEDTPAQEAGLEEGDVIIEFASQPVFSARQFRRLVAETPAGREVTMVVMREGSRRTLKARLRKRESSGWAGAGGGPSQFRFQFDPQKGFQFAPFRGRTRRGPRLGIEGQDVGEQLAQALSVPQKSGVLITRVTPGSAAAKAGLKAGDVIVSVDRHKVRNLGDLRERLEPGTLDVKVIRKGAEQTFQVTLEEAHHKRHRGKRL